MEGMSMRLRIATTGKAAEINLKGALTLGRPVENLDRAVATLISARVPEIELNLAAVPYADGSGLGALVAARISARSAGLTLRVTKASGKMRELLDMTCLETLRRADSAGEDLASGTERGRSPRRPRSFTLSRLAAHVA